MFLSPEPTNAVQIRAPFPRVGGKTPFAMESPAIRIQSVPGGLESVTNPQGIPWVFANARPTETAMMEATIRESATKNRANAHRPFATAISYAPAGEDAWKLTTGAMIPRPDFAAMFRAAFPALAAKAPTLPTNQV